MNLLKKINRSFSILAIASFSGLETKERNRRLEERLKRSEEKRKRSCAEDVAFIYQCNHFSFVNIDFVCGFCF